MSCLLSNASFSINCTGPEADSNTEPTSEPEEAHEAAKASTSSNPIGSLQEKNTGDDAKAKHDGSNDVLKTDPATLPKSTPKQDRQARNEVAAKLGVSRRQFEAILGEAPRPRGGKHRPR